MSIYSMYENGMYNGFKQHFVWGLHFRIFFGSETDPILLVILLL